MLGSGVTLEHGVVPASQAPPAVPVDAIDRIETRPPWSGRGSMFREAGGGRSGYSEGSA